MEEFWREIMAEVPDGAQFLRVSFRLTFASLLGAIPGLQRERLHEAAGLRTHMLVALGSAIFVMAPLEGGASMGDVTRVMQGITTGIGFVGAGAILKMADAHRVRGLTTAASVWLTAAVGMAVGAGRYWIPLLGSLWAFLILAVLRRLESHREASDSSE